jgi:methyl-accepting chemotaxis protein
MAESSNNSLFLSLKGTVLIATSGLALFLGVFIPVSYLALSSIIDSSSYAIMLTSLISLASVAAFGWWLSNKVAEPLNKAVLTAKTLERGSLATLPKDSGASEIDELLATLQRISIQIQRVSGSIDDVASGNLSRINSTNDRVSNSLQKLAAKVTGSFKAEKDYLKLRESLRRVSDATFTVRRGDFTSGMSQTIDETKDLVTTINVLINELRDLVKDVRIITVETKNSALAIQSKVEVYTQMSESKTKEITWATNTLKQLPEIVQKISVDLSKSGAISVISLEQTQNSLQTTQQSAVLVTQLRQLVSESMSRLHKLNEQAQEIHKVAGSMEDLANRTNLVALNASIQATSSGEHNHSFLVIAEEVEKLANRANTASKQVSSLNKAFQIEVSEFETSLGSVSREMSSVSRLAYQSGVSLQELEKQVSEIADFHEKLSFYTDNQAQSSDETFTVFSDVVTQLQIGLDELNDSAKQAAQIAKSMDMLGMTVSGFKLPHSLEAANTSAPIENLTAPTDYQAGVANFQDSFTNFQDSFTNLSREK